ncbi:MAG: aspartyl protease family protein [Odoribacter sp.]|nr:aspartyl protease family protein [Odoribacter sp.]
MAKKTKITVPIELLELEENSFHILVPASINGSIGDLIIDTGASVTVADKNIFSNMEELEMEARMVESRGITGAIEEVKILKNIDFKIGETQLEKFNQLAIIDMEYINQMYHQAKERKIMGLLGSDFCVVYKAIINYKKKIMEFYI